MPDFWLTLAAVAHAEGKVNEERQANAEAKRSALLALGPRPDDPKLLGELSVAEAGLGQNEEALRHARHAAEMLPPSVDAVARSHVRDAARASAGYDGRPRWLLSTN